MVPTQSLAISIAQEWRSIGETIDPRAMPLTGLSNAAIDRIAPDRQEFASGLVRYAEADLSCYRAEGPGELVERQEKAWQKLLAWARRHFDVEFRVTSGIVYVAQPAETVDRLCAAVGTLDPFQLAGLSPLVTIGGSLIAGLAIFYRAITAESGWLTVSLDDHWQIERWGADSEFEVALENRRQEFFAAANFLQLLRE